MLNKAMLIGNLGDDAEVRKLGSGKLVMTLRLATSERWKDKDGEKQERTEWHRVVVFGDPLINAIEDYLRKGQKIYIEGRITTRKWDDADGVTHYSTEIVVSGFDGKIVLLGQPGKREPDYASRREHEDDRPAAKPRAGARASARQKKPEPQPTKEEEDLLDDEVPF